MLVNHDASALHAATGVGVLVLGLVWASPTGRGR